MKRLLGRRRRVIAAAAVVALVWPALLLGNMARQESLDDSLVRAALRLDMSAVHTFLSQGASANSADRTDQGPPASRIANRVLSLLRRAPDTTVRAPASPVLLVLLSETVAIDSETPAGRSRSLTVNAIAMDLIAHHAEVNVRDGGGYTPLLYAILDNRTVVARALILHGADVNAVDQYGRSLLAASRQTVASYGYPRTIVRLLEEHGARLNPAGEGDSRRDPRRGS